MKDALYILIIIAVAVIGIYYADAVEDGTRHRYELENAALREEADIWRQSVEDSQQQIDALIVIADSLEKKIGEKKTEQKKIQKNNVQKTDSIRRLPAGAVLQFISAKLAQPDTGR